MPLETVHQRGAQVAVLLMSPLVVFVAIDVAKGSAVERVRVARDLYLPRRNGVARETASTDRPS
jgi:hypothetical protein